MLGTKQFLALLVLTALVSISLSNTTQKQQGTGFFERLFANNGKGLGASSASSSARVPRSHKAASSSRRSYTVLGNGTKVADSAVAEGRGMGGGGWGSPAMSGSGWGGGGGGGGGWGGGGGGGGWMYTQTTMGKKGTDLTTIIGMLALLAFVLMFLMTLFGSSSSSSSSTPQVIVVPANVTGRRRRSLDDLDDEMMEGESLPEFLTRLGTYFNTAWVEDKDTKKVKPIKLE